MPSTASSRVPAAGARVAGNWVLLVEGVRRFERQPSAAAGANSLQDMLGDRATAGEVLRLEEGDEPRREVEVVRPTAAARGLGGERDYWLA
jgi:hypothetical protein